MKSKMLLCLGITLTLTGCASTPVQTSVESAATEIVATTTHKAIEQKVPLQREELPGPKSRDLDIDFDKLEKLNEDPIWDEIIKVEEDWFRHYEDRPWQVSVFGDTVTFPTTWDNISQYVEIASSPGDYYEEDGGFKSGTVGYVTVKFKDGSWGSVNVINKTDDYAWYEDCTVAGLAVDNNCASADFYGFKCGDTFDSSNGWDDATYHENIMTNSAQYQWLYTADDNEVYANIIISTDDAGVIKNMNFCYRGE